MKDKNTIVFDIETRNTFRDVGGRSFEGLRLSIMVAYLYRDDSYRVYDEKNIGEFLKLLETADLIVGFNIIGFDLPVLKKYFDHDLQGLPLLDIMYEVMYSCGKRFKLDYLAEGSLGLNKTADGLMAVEFYRQGRIDELIDYCRQDVKITKDLYEYGSKHNYLICKKYGTFEKIPVYWHERLNTLKCLKTALRERKKVEIYYQSPHAKKAQRRIIDIYKISNNKIYAYCNLKRSLRTFRTDRVKDLNVTSQTYDINEKLLKDIRQP
jgi:DEAD/DEAH box helicase domain-containing protein